MRISSGIPHSKQESIGSDNMRTISRKRYYEEETKIWQAIIGCRADGDFGEITERLTKAWQRYHGLEPDGKVGPLTWKSANVLSAHSPELYVFRFPYDKVNSMEIKLAKRKRITQYAKGYDVVTNAVMFDMKTGRNVTDLVVKGKLDNGGNYSNEGLYFHGNTVSEAKTYQCVGMQGDFIGGAPTLISQGVKHVDMKGLPSSFYTSVTQRMAYGTDGAAFYIITTGQSHACSLDAVLNAGIQFGLASLINVDGGGSTAMVLNGVPVFDDGRPVPTTLCMKLIDTYFD